MNTSKASNQKRTSLLLTAISKYFVFIVFCSLSTQAQFLEVNNREYYSPIVELLITINTENNYSFETNVLIAKSNLLFIDVEALFKSLKIKCVPNLNGLKGFIKNETNLYTVDFENKKITVGNKIIDFKEKLLVEFGIQYISASVISKAFGLTFTFNPRSLTAKMNSNFELPFIRQLQIEKNRNNLLKAKIESNKIADTIIPRDYHLFKFGTLDWRLSSSQGTKKTSINNATINLGSELLFGEANFSMNYNTENKFDRNQLRYGWRWINNDKKIVRQARVGQVSSRSNSNLNAQLIGVTINNSSTKVKKSSGYYTINDTTEPKWTVELYINDVLIDYTVADAAGLYQFKAPIVYGYITTKLKFYGPLGEERTEERVVNTPYSFTAAKTLEYNVTAGIVQDTSKSRFSRADFNYGINRNLTVNGGLEYLSSNPNHVITPFASVAFQPFSKMTLNLAYVNNRSVNGLMNLYITKNAFLEVDYYKPLKALRNRIENLDIKFSIPIKTKLFTGLTKIKYSRNIYKSFAYNQIDFTVSSNYNQIKINSYSAMSWAAGNSPQLSSALSLSTKLAKNITLRTSAVYNLTASALRNISSSIQMRILKMNILATYSRNIATKNNSFYISAAYDLPFSRAGISSSYINNAFNFSENAQGSIAFGKGVKNIRSGNNSAMGKGTLLLYPFLDLNENNILDTGEKRVLVSAVKVAGARAMINKKDSVVRVVDLNAFVNYTVEFSDTDLDYVSWRFKHKTYQVLVNPNQYSEVYVPIVPVGEINGVISLKSGKNLKGQANVRLHIYNENGIKVAETLSEFDGYFSYLGLKPGDYTVRVDETQLETLNYQAFPAVHQVTIKVSEYGDIVDDLDFTINKNL
jgi:hypothetical protein